MDTSGNLGRMRKDEYLCSKCKRSKPHNEFHETSGADRNRQVASQCKMCRSAAYFEKRYPGNRCAQCLFCRPKLNANKICPKCNEATGLRQCQGPCGEILPRILSFYGRKRICKDCLSDSLHSGLGSDTDVGSDPTDGSA
jgi:hypothetical protein